MNNSVILTTFELIDEQKDIIPIIPVVPIETVEYLETIQNYIDKCTDNMHKCFMYSSEYNNYMCILKDYETVLTYLYTGVSVDLINHSESKLLKPYKFEIAEDQEPISSYFSQIQSFAKEHYDMIREHIKVTILMKTELNYFTNLISMYRYLISNCYILYNCVKNEQDCKIVIIHAQLVIDQTRKAIEIQSFAFK